MFVQVITGQVKDPGAVRAHLERWRDDLRPGATGFLGSTMGFADDGRFVAAVRFEDAAAAQASADRPEQGEWWAAMEPLVQGATFRDSTDTSVLFDGPDPAATFLQVMEGTVTDRAAAEATETADLEAELRKHRPDLLGGVRAWFGNDYVEIAYFTSEEEARKGESSSGFEQPQQEFEKVFGQPTYLDLRDVMHVT